MISIIIRTRNEDEWIRRCLAAVATQEMVAYETIVVDNGSTDRTLDIVGDFEARLVSISEEDFTFGKALNDGVRASSGELVCCLSGHCIPQNTLWLFWLARGFADEKVAGVYGRQKPLQQTHVLDKRDMWNQFGPERKRQSQDPFFHNANSMIRRAVWETVPFDEKSNGVEDRLWAREVQARGFDIVYEPLAGVYHPHGINQAGDIRRAERVVDVIEKSGLHLEN